MDNKRIDNWIQKRKERKASFSAENLFKELKNGNREALGTCITIIESTRVEDKNLSTELLQLCLENPGRSIRVGITGIPGVGKSTFIEAFGQYLIDQGHKVAVLAIDPSSQSSGGSILGDKTRMEHLSTKENVFIRPTAAGSALGGVARKTRETIYLCETAGYDVILIETVGVGQSETLVHSMVDFFLLLMLSGAGDELQGIKRGIMEMADALVVTKADGSNKKSALAASKAYGNAMHLFPAKSSGWISKSFTCSALENENIDQVWQTIEQYQNQTIQNGWFKFNREQQDIYWLTASLKEYILSDFFENECWLSELKKTEKLVADQKLTVFNAAEQLFKSYQNSRKNDA